MLGDACHAHGAVAHLGGDVDAPLVAGTHLREGYLPAGDEVGQTEGVGVALLGVVIEDVAVDEHALVVDGHDATDGGPVARARLQYLVEDALGGLVYALFAGLVDEELLVLFFVVAVLCHSGICV